MQGFLLTQYDVNQVREKFGHLPVFSGLINLLEEHANSSFVGPIAEIYSETVGTLKDLDLSDITDAAYDDGFTDGEFNGYGDGKNDGHEEGYDEGESEGYQRGYDEGYSAGYDAGQEVESDI